MAVTTFRQIIIYDAALDETGVNQTLYVVYWLVAPPNRLRPMPGFVSQIPSANTTPSWGITGPELSALQAGTIVERQDSCQLIVPTGAGAIENALAARYAYFQSKLTGVAPAAKYVGAQLGADGTSWTLGP